MKKRKNTAALLLFWLYTIAVPLYTENKYFNITAAKGHMVFFGSFAVLTVFGICACFDRTKEKKNMNLMDIGVICFGITALVSCLLSGSIYQTFFGTAGWRAGAGMWLVLTCAYYVLSRYLKPNRLLLITTLSVNAVILGLGILHSGAVDILHLHEGISPVMYYWYMSTLGNINWIAGYLCLLVPVLLILFLEEKNGIQGWFMYLFLGLCMMNVILCASDSIYAGFGAGFLILIPYVMKEQARIRKLFAVLILYGISLLLIGNLPFFAEKVFSMSGISVQLLDVKISAGITAVSAAGYLLARYREWSMNTRRLCILVMEGMLSAVILYFVYDLIFNFSDDWGTERGLIWRCSLDIYKNYSLKNQLIGVGPDFLREVYSELSEHTSRKVLVSHSEPLQYLLTMGIAGLISWGMMWAGTIHSFVQKKGITTAGMAFFLALICYGVQSLFNSCSAMNAALFITVLAMFRNNLEQ